MGVSRIVLLFTIAIVMAIFVVWERNKIIEIGYQVAKLQKNCDALAEKNRKLTYHVSRLKSPEIIAYKIQSLKIPLIFREDPSGTIIADQIKFKDDVLKFIKTGLNKDLYSQKGSILNCCSLHNN